MRLSSTLGGMCERRRATVYLAVVLAFFCVQSQAVRYFTDVVHTGQCRISVKCTDINLLNGLGFYGARCSRLLDTVLGIKEKPLYRIQILELVEGGETLGRRDDMVQIGYRVGGNELEFAHALFRALVSRRLEQLTGQEPKTGGFMEVLTAGLCHRYVRGRHALSGYYEPDYEMARNLFMRGEYPKLEGLFLGGMPLEYRAFFELYMMHCDLLLLSLETLTSRHGEILQELAKAEQSGESLVDAYARLTKRFWQANDTAQAYYERNVFRVSRRKRRMSGEDVIAERVLELETVPVLGIEGGSVMRRVPLEEVPNVLEDYKTDVQGVLRLENRFRDLLQASPYLLRPSLEHYAQALSHLREGNEGTFRKEIIRARTEFKTALARQKRMQALMDDYERTHVPIMRQFDDYLHIIEHYHRIAERIYPSGLFSKQAP